MSSRRKILWVFHFFAEQGALFGAKDIEIRHWNLLAVQKIECSVENFRGFGEG